MPMPDARLGKILLLTEIFPPQTGGSGRWFWEIYGRLPADRIFIAAGRHPRQFEFDRSHDLPIERMDLTVPNWGVRHWSGLRRYLRIFLELRRLIQREKIEVIHCARCLPEGLVALLLKRWLGIPYLCYVHGEEINVASGSRELTWLARKSLHQASLVLANSNNSQRMLCGQWGLGENAVRVLHPGVDTEHFTPAAPDIAWRQARGWDGRKVIVTVGRLQRRKGHDQMIAALPQIRQSIPNVLYAIVGDGEERKSLEHSAQSLGVVNQVQFIGEVDDHELRNCYQQCDLFALPNRQIGKDIEGFGMVLLEAQACGRPVLAGDSGGTAETMQVPDTGRIVDCTGPALLAEAVIELLSNPEQLERMGQAARLWVERQFDWSPLSLQARALFSSVASPRGMPSGRGKGADRARDAEREEVSP